MKMTMKNNSSQRFIIVLGVIAAICEIGLCIEESMGNLGGLRRYVSQNSGEIDSVARFAVEEHNKKQKKNSLLEFSRVVDAKEQVVAGKLYHLTLEAYEAGGTKNTYEAKVWIKPWMNFKQLQEFKPSPSRGEGN